STVPTNGRKSGPKPRGRVSLQGCDSSLSRISICASLKYSTRIIVFDRQASHCRGMQTGHRIATKEKSRSLQSCGRVLAFERWAVSYALAIMSPYWPKVDIRFCVVHVRHKADVPIAAMNVRFRG